jgi:hypothetical protein
MNLLKVNFSSLANNYWFGFDYFAFDFNDKFKNYFFNDLNIEIIFDNDYNTDGKIYYIQDHLEFDKNKINIMLCVENCYYWKHYTHYNKFKNFLNNDIKIYFYNHINKIVINENFLAIPVIYTQINYFNKFYNVIKPTNFTEYADKKYCLIATILNNKDKVNIYNCLSMFGKCDFISNFKDIIGNKSSYHSIELLNLFNQYKFVFVCENSIEDGYITEKIFNCFFSRTIPIYFGSNKINYYFNSDTFINVNNYKNLNDFFIKIKNTNTVEKYNSIINTDIINKDYNDENYKEIFNNFIQKLLL